jgi:arginase
VSAVNRIVVPYFIGEPMPGFVVPEPNVTIDPPLAPGPAQHRMGVLYRALAEAVASTDRPIVYAGDCLATIGALGGLQRKGVEPTVVWFDAHGDFHTWETTPSEFLGGMPLAMLVGRGEQTVMIGAGASPIDEARVVLVDARDLDDSEPVAGSRLNHVTLEELEAAIPLEGDLYVHVDVDVVDPAEMPAVNYPSPGGPSLAGVASSLAMLGSSGRVVAVSLSSWNPALPDADRAEAATEVLVTSIS